MLRHPLILAIAGVSILAVAAACGVADEEEDVPARIFYRKGA